MSNPFLALRSTLCLIALVVLVPSHASTTRWQGSSEIFYEFGGYLETRYFSGFFDVDTDLRTVTDYRFSIFRDSSNPLDTIRTYLFSPSSLGHATLSRDGLFVLQSPPTGGAFTTLDFFFLGADFYSASSVEAYGHFTEARPSETYYWTDVQFTGQVLATPIPEPATYAMMVAGLGLLGFAARRRNYLKAPSAPAMM